MHRLYMPRIQRITFSVVAAICMNAATTALAGGWVHFENQTEQRLVAEPILGAEDPEEKDYAWGDVDRDGDTDVVCVRKYPFDNEGGRENVLFMNEGVREGHAIDGVFVDRTEEFALMSDVTSDMGFKTQTNDRDVALVDVNGDDWLDIVTAVTLSDGAPKHISHPRIYINLGEVGGVWQGFRFENDRIPALAVLPDDSIYAPRFCAVAAGDVDNDGDADLYFADGDPFDPTPPFDVDLDERLLTNDGTGVFQDVTEARLTPDMIDSTFAMAVAIEDINRDGAMDIVRDNAYGDFWGLAIFYNDQDNVGYFDYLDLVYDQSPYHVSVGNLNNDDLMDLVISDDGDDVYLLHDGVAGNGTADWVEHSFLLENGAHEEGYGGNSVITDIDDDGFNDVYITGVDIELGGTCSELSHLYRNLGDTPNVTLQEVDGPMPWTPAGVHDVAIFDINGDGLKDLFLGRCTGTEVWLQVDVVAPEIVHGAQDVSFSDHAFSGFIDPRAESSDGVNVNLGLSELTIIFSEPVVDIGGTELTAGAFTLNETGGGAPPEIVGFEMLDDVTAHITLDRILTLQEWLTVTVAAEDLGGNPLPNLGNLGPGVDEADRVDVAFLPGDVDLNSIVSPFDLLTWRQINNDLTSPDPGLPEGVHNDFIDTDRTGVINPFDLLRFRQLINGISPPATRQWSGETMNNPRP